MSKIDLSIMTVIRFCLFCLLCLSFCNADAQSIAERNGGITLDHFATKRVGLIEMEGNLAALSRAPEESNHPKGIPSGRGLKVSPPSPSLMIQKPVIGLPVFNSCKQPFFCKIESQIERKSRFAPRFRLGSLDYTNWLEQKYPLHGIVSLE